MGGPAVYEDFIGMVSVECTNASSLKSVILDCLICCNLPISGCCGQAYDGAAVMAGHLTGVAVQILRMEPKAISIHCLAHSLNLSLQDCAAQSKPIREGLSLANELHNLIKMSPKRLASICRKNQVQVYHQLNLYVQLDGLLEHQQLIQC